MMLERSFVEEHLPVSQMMKYHPLMTKELRKTYSLLAAAAMRAMTPEFKYGVKKQFNRMNTSLRL